MRTETPGQLNRQWKRISGHVRRRGGFMEYFRIYARYRNRMARHLGSSPYWQINTGCRYTEGNDAPAPRKVYAGH